jgi:hypothetical protein
VAAEAHALGQRQHREAGLERQRAEQAAQVAPSSHAPLVTQRPAPWRRIVIAATPA